MEEKLIIKLSRRIEYLVHKRHRSLRHIQRAIQHTHLLPGFDEKESDSGSGVFWMNSVFLNRKVIEKVLGQQISEADLKVKTDRYFYLGFSLGKIIDLGNAANIIYTLLQLFEEYESYVSAPKGQASLETNAILRHIMPHSQDRKQAQYEDFLETLSLSESTLTTSFAPHSGTDHLETVRKPALDQMTNIYRAGGNQQINQQEDHKQDNRKFKSSLPAPETHFNNYEDYIMKSSSLATSALTQSQHPSSSNPNHHSADGALQLRIHAQKVDPRAPSFKVFSCPAIAINMNYCEVSSSLIDMLILVYNKMYDNQYLNPQMLSYIEKIDTIIVNKVIKALCEDINKVARYQAVKQLAKINKALKMETFVHGRNPELARVPSDDNIFEITPLDLEANNKMDLQLLAAATGNSQVRQSSERPERM